MLLKAREIAEKYKIHHDSLLKWERDGKLQSHRTVGGHRRWAEEDIQELLKVKEEKVEKKYAFYARCSTAKQKENLDRQVERLREHCKEKGYKDVVEYFEIGSGLNDNRTKLHKLIEAVITSKVNHIVVEYKDRLARYGLKFMLHFFKGLGCEMEFLDAEANKSDNEELVADVLSLFTCFSARLYGKRGGRPRKNKLQEQLEIGVATAQDVEIKEITEGI
jgi:predicted site-specific integrase-resolvase